MNVFAYKLKHVLTSTRRFNTKLHNYFHNHVAVLQKYFLNNIVTPLFSIEVLISYKSLLYCQKNISFLDEKNSNVKGFSS